MTNLKVVKPSERPPFITLNTTLGVIVVELYWNHAPNTCNNFYQLAKRGYYNNTIFHRIVRNFMIQGGDPTGVGNGGASIYGHYFEDEFHPELKHTGAGILSMANSGPNTNGSQFYITLIPTPWLDNCHTIFGRIASGMIVVKQMGLVETDPNEKPLHDIRIITANVTVGV